MAADSCSFAARPDRPATRGGFRFFASRGPSRPSSSFPAHLASPTERGESRQSAASAYWPHRELPAQLAAAARPSAETLPERFGLPGAFVPALRQPPGIPATVRVASILHRHAWPSTLCKCPASPAVLTVLR